MADELTRWKQQQAQDKIRAGDKYTDEDVYKRQDQRRLKHADGCVFALSDCQQPLSVEYMVCHEQSEHSLSLIHISEKSAR